MRPSPTTANGLVRSTSAPPPDASCTTKPDVVRTPGKIRPAVNDAGVWSALVNSASVRTLATVAPAAQTTMATSEQSETGSIPRGTGAGRVGRPGGSSRSARSPLEASVGTARNRELRCVHVAS